MIEVINIKPIRKNTLLASCDVHIIPWKMTLHDIKVFEKGSSRWITLPSKEIIGDMGEKKYVEMISFDTEDIRKRFRSQIMLVIDKFLEANPDMKPEEIIRENDDLPF